jgi:hypothetical protein
MEHKENSLGNLHSFNEAIECYDKALEINPIDIDVKLQRANTIRKMKLGF